MGNWGYNPTYRSFGPYLPGDGAHLVIQGSSNYPFGWESNNTTCMVVLMDFCNRENQSLVV